MISLVIPTLNAAEPLRACLASVSGAREAGLVTEVVVADGGSTDTTREVATEHGAGVIGASGGRGGQLAVGCGEAAGDWLLALHADARLQPGWEVAARRHMEARPERAGWFRFALDDPRPVARAWERGVNVRSQLLGLPYGDQGLLISRALYGSVGGYRPLALFEDVDLVRRLGRRRLAEIPARAVTSAIRYRREGYWARSRRNWALTARYVLGEDPAELARAYSTAGERRNEREGRG